MLAQRRAPMSAPLCDLRVTDSLRLRRRQGRASYLIALFTERRAKSVTQPAPSGQEQGAAHASKALRAS